jgi:bacterioferritin-associated ferredoxin
MYVCLCNAVTDSQIAVAVEAGATKLRDLNRELGVAGQCGKCACFAKQVLDECLVEQARREPAAA